MTNKETERLTVEVALIGNPDEPVGHGVLDQSFFDMPYSARRQVTLEADEHESLAAVMDRAAAMMDLRAGGWMEGGFTLRSNRIAFYKPEDEQAFAPRGVPRVLANELILVDQDGRAIFGVYDHRSVTFADLLRAGEAGTLDGDPLRPYLMLDMGWGDAPPPDWATLLEGLEVAWQVVQGVGVVGGAAAFLGKVRDWLNKRVGAARDALRAHPEWMQKGYRPDQFEALIAPRDWTAAEIAPLLGCTEAEAEAVLWTLGFALDPETQRWKKNADEAASVLADIRTAIAWAEKNGPGWEAQFREWLTRYLETGERPPFESLRPSFDDEDEDWEYRPTAGERLDELLARFRRN